MPFRIPFCRRNTLFSFSCITLVLFAWQLLYTINFSPRNDEETEFNLAILIASRRDQPTLKSQQLYPDTADLRLKEQAESLRKAKIEIAGVNVQVKRGKRGQVNLHEWADICGDDLRTLLYFPLFPKAPSTRKFHNSLTIKGNGNKYGKRVFGYIIPQENGSYSFRLDASGSAEFWLSTDEHPENSQNIAWTYSRKPVKSKDFKGVKLTASKSYYFEMLHKHDGAISTDKLRVQWRFGGKAYFQDITKESLKAFYDDSLISKDTVNANSFKPPGFRHSSQRPPSSVPLRERILSVPFMSEATVKRLFPRCQREHSRYVNMRHVNLFKSLWEMKYTSIYPSDFSNRTDAVGMVSFGNDLMEEAEAKEIISEVTEKIHSASRKYELKDVVNVEKKSNRFLVELLLKDKSTGKDVRFSEYLFQQENKEFCYLEEFSWNRNSMVNFIVVSGRNQGKWVLHFINNIQQIQQDLGDKNINVIVVDFLSPNADLKGALENSTLKNYMLFENTAKFEKSLAIQQGVSGGVLHPDDIVVVLDLHLQVPASFVEDIRKHTIKGRQVFSPILERLECGVMPYMYEDKGRYWEFHGLGLVGVYKEDWDNFGGMNYKMFRDRWGGEDVEMTDRIVMAGMQVERRKVVDLYHYFHTKKGMWNNS